MCGIVGIVNSKKQVTMDALVRMRDTMIHRGPDACDAWVSSDSTVGLAHRRLSIIDLSETGRQPMIDEREGNVITFNGEIYNFQNIARDLKAEGYLFRGNSDTEVLLNAYSRWGIDCLEHLNGMWAFAIWDPKKKRLFFSRDRVGMKPLYYACRPRHFSFASQIKALIVEPQTDYRFDLNAMNCYLGLGYVPDDQCIASPAKKLPPGHAGIYDFEKDELKTWRYWSPPLPETNASQSPNQYYELLDEMENLMSESTRLRLISDVPLGVLLSGGLDSSLVTAFASRHSRGTIKTFNISFPEHKQYDESPYARCVAEYFGTDHYELEAPPVCLDLLEELATYFDEPLADSSLLPTFLVSRLCRDQVTVAVGGDGGDELFAGYPKYVRDLAFQRKWGWTPKPVWKGFAGLAAHLPAGFKGRNFLSSLHEGPLGRCVHNSTFFNPTLRKRILKNDVLHEIGGAFNTPEEWLAGKLQLGTDNLDRMTRQDFHSYLPDDILFKVDRASMAVGLEVRAPWLDHRIVEFAFGKVPHFLKVKGDTGRWLQKELAKRVLPSNLDINRKQGFSVPIDSWLRTANGINAVKECLLPAEGLPWFKESEIEGLINGHLKGRANGARLFALQALVFSFSSLRKLGLSV